MTPSARRILIPVIVIAVALGVVLIVVRSKPTTTSPPSGPEPSASREVAADDATGPAGAADPSADAAAAPGGETAPVAPLTDLRAVAPETGERGHDTPSSTLGSFDPAVAPFRLELSRAGRASSGSHSATCGKPPSPDVRPPRTGRR